MGPENIQTYNSLQKCYDIKRQELYIASFGSNLKLIKKIKAEIEDLKQAMKEVSFETI